MNILCFFDFEVFLSLEGNKGRVKIYRVPGPGPSTGGRRLLFDKNRGRRLFSKKLGDEDFFSKKIRVARLFLY